MRLYVSENAEIPISAPNVEAGGKEIDEILDQYNQAVQLKSQFDLQCKAMYKLYASYYQRKTYKFINNIDIPLPFKLIETLTPFMCANMPNPNCTPIAKKDVDAAMRMDAVMKHYLRRPQNMIELTHVYKNMLTYSIGIAKDGWDFRKGAKRRWVKNIPELMQLASLTPGMEQVVASGDPAAVVQMAQQGSIPGVTYDQGYQWFIVNDLDICDAPTYQCIHPLDFFWFGIGDDIDQMTALFHRYYKTKADVERMIYEREPGFDVAKLQHVLATAPMRISTSDDLLTGIGLISGQSNCYEFIERTTRDTKTGKIIVATISKDANVIVAKWEGKYFHNRFNYSVIRMYPKKGEFVGTPLLKVVESLCAAVNQMGNQILDNGLLALHRVFIRRKGAKSREKQFSLFAGAIIDGRPEDFKVLDIPDVRQNSLSMLQMFMGFIASITGVHDILDQPAPGSPDAAGIEQLNFMNTARIKQQHFMDMQAINGLMERMSSNILQYVRSTMNVKVKTSGGATHYLDINPEDLVGEYEFDIDVKQMQASNSAVSRAQLQTLLNMSVGLMRAYTDPKTGQTTPRLIADVERLYKAILATYDNIGRPEQYVVDPADDKAIPPQMIPPPQPQAPPEASAPPQQMASSGGAPQSLAQMSAAMPTASGAGLPPQLGGPQQNSVNNNYSNPMPKSPADVLQSARSLQ